MNKEVGLWIDHRKAIVVTITAEGEVIQEILSEVEKQPRRSGDSPLKGSYEAVQMPADNRLQRVLTEHLNIYYDTVIESTGNTESILIFGPGEAKHELKERIAVKYPHRRVERIETVDQMTDRQVAAKVRQQFTKSR
jgi:hypothetical protein